MRLSSHSLRIHTGRYVNSSVPRNERYCLYCRLHDIEDEFHFILKCPCYSEIRKRFIKKYYYNRPSMSKFVELMSCNNVSVISNVCRFIRDALTIRINLEIIQN